MRSFGSQLAKSWLALAWLAGISFPGSFTANQTNGNKTPSTQVSAEQFIAAFELTPKGDFRFTWPPDSMRPAHYERVLLVVEKMPHAWDAKHQEGRPTQLRARDHLRINDHPPTALANMAGQPQAQSAESAERFLVRLDQGRLRIRLVIPPELRLDPLHNHARIRLYSPADNNGGMRPW